MATKKSPLEGAVHVFNAQYVVKFCTSHKKGACYGTSK